LPKSQPIKSKTPGPGRKRPKETLGMPDRYVTQDPREGY
jgi:hypothetical protein